MSTTASRSASSEAAGRERTSRPAAPQKTRPLFLGVTIASVVTVLFALAILENSLTEASPATRMSVSGVVAIALVIAFTLPVSRSFRRRRESLKAWESGDYVEARRKAAWSRKSSIAGLGVIGVVVVVVALYGLVTINGGAVGKTFLNWDLMVLSLPEIAAGFGINVVIALSAQALSMLFGLTLALARFLPGKGLAPLRFLAIAYVDLFRGIPAIVVIYLVCYGLPLTKVPVLGDLPPIVYAIVAITLVYSAYNAENFRSGIQSVHHSQKQAALSLGMSSGSVTRLVIMPQVIRNLAPTLLSAFVALQKDTALVNVVGIIDAFTQARIYSANYFNLSSITVVCILFVLITIPQTRLVDYLLAKTDRNKRS